LQEYPTGGQRCFKLRFIGHNYHHAFPWDYRAAELGAKYNLTTMFIDFYARLGLVWDLKKASDESIIARANRTGDGTPIFAQPKRHL